MNIQEAYHYGVIAVMVLALTTFIFLFFFPAPYGRYSRANWGPDVNPRRGWVLMELPSVVIFAFLFIVGHGFKQKVPVVLLSLWELHYLQRTFIYPTLMRVGKTSMPITIMVLGWIFNLINSFLNATAITQVSNYGDVWLVDPRFLLGVTLFFLGFTINIHSDNILRNLRGPGESGYKIPYGGLYRWITAPNYFGEIVEWFGWALACRSLAGVAFAFFTLANLVPRGKAHHDWYNKNFSDYPKSRKAIVPGIF